MNFRRPSTLPCYFRTLDSDVTWWRDRQIVQSRLNLCGSFRGSFRLVWALPAEVTRSSPVGSLDARDSSVVQRQMRARLAGRGGTSTTVQVAEGRSGDLTCGSGDQ